MSRFFSIIALLCALLAPAPLFAQGSQRISTAIANVGSNARVLANAQITVCQYSVGNPTSCATPVTVYQDPAMTTPYTTTFRADGNGNYSYWAPAGNYVEQLCATGAQCKTQVITLGGTGGGTTNLPPNAIPYQGNSGTQPVAATSPNIVAPFSSISYVNGQYTVIGTTFNEGASGTNIVGTKPATDVPNTSWVVWTGAANGWQFASGGGATSSTNVTAQTINTTLTDETVTFSGLTNTNSQILAVRYQNNNNWLGVTLKGASGVSLVENVSGVQTTVGSNSSIPNGATGSVVVVLAGNSVTVTPFGGTPITYTIPAGHGTLSGTSVGIFDNAAGTFKIGGVSVMAAGYVPSNVACAGFLNADGTCSTSGANAFGVLDNNGHFVALPEKGTATSAAGASLPVTMIAWQDDFSAGVYDPRDPQWGAQDTPAHQAAAIQNMENRIACDIAMGKVNNPTAKFPSGVFNVDQLQIAPGSSFIGNPSAQGLAGTIIQNTYYNHNTATMPSTMTVTCSDGLSHTDSSGMGLIQYIHFIGCGNGGCSNAPGDTGTYLSGGMGDTGIQIKTLGSEIADVFAEKYGNWGIQSFATDAKVYRVRTGNDGLWFYYGGYKGALETLASSEVNAVTTGSTGSVALAWPSVTGATQYVVYRGTTAGGENTFYLTGTNSFTDTCAAGTSGAVNGDLTSTIGTPTGVTATPSSTGGTCAAGTYFYRVSALSPDSNATTTTGQGWHGTIEIVGLDNEVRDVEAYGLQDLPNVYNYHHVADIVVNSSEALMSNLWPQLGQVGIADPAGSGGEQYDHIRIDATQLEAMFVNDVSVSVSNMQVNSACRASNATTLNTGQVAPVLAGTCNSLLDFSGPFAADNVQFNYQNIFNPTYKTADYASFVGKITHTNGTPQVTSGNGVLNGVLFDPQGYQSIAITGPTPSLGAFTLFNPTDGAPVTYTGFYGGVRGQDFYLIGGNANVTLQNNSVIQLCTGHNLNLGTVAGMLHFRHTDAYEAPGAPMAVSQVCSPGNQDWWDVAWNLWPSNLPPTEQQGALDVIGTGAVHSPPALASFFGQNGGTPGANGVGGSYNYVYVVWVGGGKMISPLSSTFNLCLPKPGFINNPCFTNVIFPLPGGWTRYQLYRNVSSDSTATAGLILDVQKTSPQPAVNASWEDTQIAPINSTTIPSAWYGTVMMGTWNIDPSGIPQSTSWPGVPGQVKIDTTPSTGGIWYCTAEDTWQKAPLFWTTPTGATVTDYSGGAAVTRTPGTNVSAVNCTSSICTTARGNLSIVGGTATTGTIATIGFTDSPTSTLTCEVHQEGGTSWFGINHSISLPNMTITAANSVSGQTIQVNYTCSQ